MKDTYDGTRVQVGTLLIDPTGTKWEVCDIDIRVGNRFRYEPMVYVSITSVDGPHEDRWRYSLYVINEWIRDQGWTVEGVKQ